MGLTALARGDEPGVAVTAAVDSKNEAVENQNGDPFNGSKRLELLRAVCFDCHQGKDSEANFDIAELTEKTAFDSDLEAWTKISNRLADGTMPPPNHTSPSSADRASLIDWIRGSVHKVICDSGLVPGGPMIRRLNRHEYANTIRDLLGIQTNAGHDLPSEGAGGEGFDNASETLFISPIHAEKFLDAARSSLEHALKNPDWSRQILLKEPGEDEDPSEVARQILGPFLYRAFRRPVPPEELEQYVDLFRLGLEQESSFRSAIRLALEAAMISPHFLFLFEHPNDGPEPVLVSNYEMASRLSYFLWASMPDKELLDLAEQGKLHDEDVLRLQVKRMLDSPKDRRGWRRDSKVRGFASSFIEQWLGTRALGREFKPNVDAGQYDSELEGGMKYEPIFFFEDLLSENRSLLNLIDSDFTYANRRLARHYGLDGNFREQPIHVELPKDSVRGGLLGMSAVLAISSFPHRTSPVLRGKWILETMLGTPPPPPPPGVPSLDANPVGKGMTVRERLELHRKDPNCASCHASLDPLGFGLENFDVLGRWRGDLDGKEIDARGRLPDGTTFDGPEELRQLLLQRKDVFIRHLTSKVLGYALARGLNQQDQCAVDAIAERVADEGYLAETLVFEIVRSVPFRYKQGMTAGRSVVIETKNQ